MKKLELKPRIYVLCNGELAEPQYFQDFKDFLKTHNIIIRYKKEFLQKAPWDFIRASIQFKKEEESNSRFIAQDGDQMWCVFDVDNYWEENEKEFRVGLQLAESNGLKIAWSNECFEFWFLCHFSLYNMAIPRKDYTKKLIRNFKAKKLGSYTKNMKKVFALLYPFHQIAFKNAKTLYKKSEVQRNPSTAIFLLVEEFLKHFC